VPIVGGGGRHGDQPALVSRRGGDQSVGNNPGSVAGGLGATLTQPGRGYTGVDVGVETIAINAFRPLSPV